MSAEVIITKPGSREREVVSGDYHLLVHSDESPESMNHAVVKMFRVYFVGDHWLRKPLSAQ